MKQHIILSFIIALALIAPMVPSSAEALSCLATDEYLKSVVGDETIVIFTGTATDQIEGDGYTAEVLTVEEGKQGWVEEELFVYHEKSMEWGYLCNTGPGKEGEKGLYVAHLDANGKYNVYQRLALTDPLVKTLEEDLEDAEVEGGVSETTATDRMNQIMTTITDLIKQVQILMKEYVYWQVNP
jgi:hypothetical protein